MFMFMGKGVQYFNVESVIHFFFLDNSVDITHQKLYCFHSFNVYYIQEHIEGDHEETYMLVLLN